jgi:hypothetical protein
VLVCAGKRVVVLESRLIGSGQTGRSVGDMTGWHTGLFSSLERWTTPDQRKQVGVCVWAQNACVELVFGASGSGPVRFYSEPWQGRHLLAALCWRGGEKP